MVLDCERLSRRVLCATSLKLDALYSYARSYGDTAGLHSCL